MIVGCLTFETASHGDSRGYFREIFKESVFPGSWRQLNYSVSRRNVVRGLHVTPFGKLVSCVKGRVYDVVVDPRPDSPTYLRWTASELSPENGRQIYVPPHCGHGFMSLEEESIVVYLQENCYDPKAESVIYWRDPTYAVDWPQAETYILSDKDGKGRALDVECHCNRTF